MAKLEENGFILNLKPISNGVINTDYTLEIKYKTKSVFNRGLFMDYHKQGVVNFSDDGERNFLLRSLEAALSKKEPQAFEPSDPFVKIGIYPDMYFPFYHAKSEIVYISEEMQKELSDSPIYYTLIFFIDSISYRNEIYHTDCGPALILTVEEDKLKQFAQDLREELAEIVETPRYLVFED